MDTRERLEPAETLNLSYNMKIAAHKMRALGHYFRASKLLTVGDDTERIARGYADIGNAYGILAGLNQQDSASSAELKGDDAGGVDIVAQALQEVFALS